MYVIFFRIEDCRLQFECLPDLDDRIGCSDSYASGNRGGGYCCCFLLPCSLPAWGLGSLSQAMSAAVESSFFLSSKKFPPELLIWTSAENIQEETFVELLDGIETLLIDDLPKWSIFGAEKTNIARPHPHYSCGRAKSACKFFFAVYGMFRFFRRRLRLKHDLARRET